MCCCCWPPDTSISGDARIVREVLYLGIGTLAAKMARSRHDLSFLAAKLEILMVHDPSMTEGCSEHSFACRSGWWGQSY